MCLIVYILTAVQVRVHQPRSCVPGARGALLCTRSQGRHRNPFRAEDRKGTGRPKKSRGIGAGGVRGRGGVYSGGYVQGECGPSGLVLDPNCPTNCVQQILILSLDTREGGSFALKLKIEKKFRVINTVSSFIRSEFDSRRSESSPKDGWVASSPEI